MGGVPVRTKHHPLYSNHQLIPGEMNLLKACSTCGVAKPLSEFHKFCHSKDGHRAICKACRVLPRTLADRAEIHSRLERGSRPCTRCGTERPLAEFKKASGRCRSCRAEVDAARRAADLDGIREREKEYTRKWRAENPEKETAKKQRWRARDTERAKRVAVNAAQRRRARMADLPFETIDRYEIYARDKGVCHICGKRCPREKFELDHLISVVMGGGFIKENLRVAHRSCNVRMGYGRLPAQLLLFG